ncbi:ATP-binding protein [Nocardioides marmoriginsengisoli]|uniref:ATP-binding protein n=1 Tax=Nocardioides marmoriginsengisoli TaxID=661483 RepID=A0A3N0CBL9_9ACTN|nr:ATP-binding protein [Nocardioides marmoriginsengisoli]RNL60373.1 ATP-binding protein [Nocardioides marmoriginsengisoli]
MPIWRSPALEELLETSLDESGLTEAVIQRLVALGVRETEQLDFKATPHLAESGAAASPPAKEKGWSPEQEFAKDVCSFANHLGGLLVIGVKDEKDVAVDAVPAVTDPAAVTQRLRQALVNHASPAPQFHVVPVEAAAGGFYLVLIVPPSSLAPHAVRGATGNERRPLHYPVRDNTGTRWLLEHEVAERYRARFGGRAAMAALRDQTVGSGLDALQRADTGTWLYLAVVPEAPAPQRLDKSALEAMTTWWHREYQFVSPLQRFLRAGILTPAPERITLSESPARADEEAADPRGDAYAELYVDGRAFVATPIVTNTSREDPACIGERTLADDTILLTDLALSWASHQAGAWGGADVVVGIAEQGLTTGEFDPPLTLQAASNDGLHRIRGTRAIRRPIQSESTADLAEAADPPGRLRAARDALTVLLHHFGIAEPTQLEADGTIVGWGWGDRRQQVERWARDRGVPFRLHPSRS